MTLSISASAEPKLWTSVSAALQSNDTSKIIEAYYKYLCKDGKNDSLVLTAHNELAKLHIINNDINGIYSEYCYFKTISEEYPMLSYYKNQADYLKKQYDRLVNIDMSTNNLDGIWISDYFTNEGIPYIAIKIEYLQNEKRFIGCILPGCTLSDTYKAYGYNNDNITGFSKASSLKQTQDGSMELKWGKGKLSQYYQELSLIAYDNILDIRAEIQEIVDNYQEILVQETGMRDIPLEITNTVVDVGTLLWAKAIYETGNTKQHIGESIAIRLRVQNSPGQLQAQIGYLGLTIDSGMPSGTPPDAEWEQRNCRLYKLYPHNQILFKCKNNAIITSCYPYSPNIFKIHSTTKDTLPSSSNDHNTMYSTAHLIYKYNKYNKKLFEGIYFKNIKPDKAFNDSMRVRLITNTILPMLKYDDLGKELLVKDNMDATYHNNKFPELVLRGFDNTPCSDTISAISKYSGEITIRKINYLGKITSYSIYRVDGTYIHANSISDSGVSNGVINNSNFYYKGDFVGISKEGYGEAVFSNGVKYLGEWHDNLRNGSGVLIGPNGEYWEGHFISSKPQFGHGTLILENGCKITGSMEDGVFIGDVKVEFPNKEIYIGKADKYYNPIFN